MVSGVATACNRVLGQPDFRSENTCNGDFAGFGCGLVKISFHDLITTTLCGAGRSDMRANQLGE